MFLQPIVEQDKITLTTKTEPHDVPTSQSYPAWQNIIVPYSHPKIQ